MIIIENGLEFVPWEMYGAIVLTIIFIVLIVIAFMLRIAIKWEIYSNNMLSDYVKGVTATDKEAKEWKNCQKAKQNQKNSKENK